MLIAVVKRSRRGNKSGKILVVEVGRVPIYSQSQSYSGGRGEGQSEAIIRRVWENCTVELVGGRSKPSKAFGHLNLTYRMIVNTYTTSRMLVKVVSDLQATLRTDPRYLAPTISESWLRQYQVLQFNACPDV